MLSRLGEVRPEERRGATAAFVTLFGILAGHTLLETARDALFLARIPPARLPFMYIAIAGLAVILSRLPAPRLGRLSSRATLSLLLVGSALANLALWELSEVRRGRWLLYTLYIWCGLFGTVVTIQFYGVLAEIYDLTQAKRLYRIIGTGSMLGAILGAGIAGVMAAALPARHLILASAGCLLVSSLGPALFSRVTPQSAAPTPALSMSASLNLILRHPYAGPLAGLVLSSTMALTLADYIFKSAVVKYVPGEALGQFFAAVYLLLNALALFVQIVVVGWLLRRFGVHRALVILPALLIAGSSVLLAGAGLAAALWLKGADGSLRYSLHRTGTELLYVPLPDAIRARAKPFIDVACQRGGQALASLLILTPVAFVPQSAFLALTLLILSALWIVTASDLKDNYLDLFRTALRQGSIVTSADVPELDLGSLEAIFAALNSSDDAEVVGALELLAVQGKVFLIPALILYHPSKTVALRALELFAAAKRNDFLPIADRLLGHADPAIRAAALRARGAIKADQTVLEHASHDPSPRVRATALVGLVSGGWVSPEVHRALAELLDSQSPEAGAALAQAIRQQPDPAFVATLLDLSEAPEPGVLSDVAEAMAAMPDEGFLPALLPMLAQRSVRDAARAAFLAQGAAGLAFLERASADHALPQEIRRHLPRTISHFPAAAAAPLLLRQLELEPDGMVRFRILRGLGRIHNNHPDLPLDAVILERATTATLQAALKVIDWRLVLEAGAAAEERRRTPTHELLVRLLRDKQAHAVERLFRLLGLQFRHEDLRSIYRARSSANARIRSSSRELLENLLLPPVRDAVLCLHDELADGERLARASALYTPRALHYEALLGVMLEEASESLRCLVAHHVAELGLVAFLPRLEALQASEKGFFVSRVLERALTLLGPPGRLERA